MRICIIGKFPPIQGGVSMRTYWTAHGLAARGHEVHVVTNAKEAAAPFRMYMRAEDWKRCEARSGSGSVTVHWTDPADRSQSYIPMASPFVSKLAAIAGRAHSERPFDLVFSHYMEPYGVAGHLAAEMTGVPHVVRMAGSDAGRLWRHAQFEALYDHVLRSAEAVIAGGAVAERAVERGVDRGRIAFGGGFVVPEDIFTPEGPALDLVALRAEVERDPGMRHLLWGRFAADRPYFGVCGKLGENKGSFALLAAMNRLRRAGLDVGLVALAHGQPAVERRFRARAQRLGLADSILQIPFLPHWRVPEFLRGCLAVCCLEQDFPIVFHTPIIPREVLLCGACLVGSTEVIRKLPAYGRLPSGYGCVAIEDVNDANALAERLAAIAKDPKPAAGVGARGRVFAREIQQNIPSIEMLAPILEAAAARRRRVSTAAPSAFEAPAEEHQDRFPLTRLAEHTIEQMHQPQGTDFAAAPLRRAIDLPRARDILADLERRVGAGATNLARLVPAVEVEIAVAAAEGEASSNATDDGDPLFRLRIRRWALADGDLAELVPVRAPRLRVLEFNCDVAEFMDIRTVAHLPSDPFPRRSYLAVFGQSGSKQRSPLVVDQLTALILQLSDGTRTACDIAAKLRDESAEVAPASDLRWIESLFVHGLISLYEPQADFGDRSVAEQHRFASGSQISFAGSLAMQRRAKH